MIDRLIELLNSFKSESSYFTPEELEYGDYSDVGIEHVDTVSLGSGRWTEHKQIIVEFNGKLYAIEYELGLTEMQENEFYPDSSTVYEVDRQEKVVYTYKKK